MVSPMSQTIPEFEVSEIGDTPSRENDPKWLVNGMVQIGFIMLEDLKVVSKTIGFRMKQLERCWCPPSLRTPQFGNVPRSSYLVNGGWSSVPFHANPKIMDI